MAEDSSHMDGTSRLLELLRRVGREEPGAIGFGRPRPGPTRRAPLALIAALPTAADATIRAARAAGADAVFVPVTAESVPSAAAAEGVASPLCGIAVAQRAIAPADLDRWQAAGIDAVAVQPSAALAACFTSRRSGLLALLDQQLPFDGLRAIAGLAVEGFVLHDAQPEGRLTGDDLLWLTLAAGLVRGPALLLSSRIVAEDLEALVAAGINGIAVRFSGDHGEEHMKTTLGGLRTAVNGLDPHLRQGRQERAGLGPVTIPSASLQGAE
jgi:hypothetical protein